MNIRSLTRGDGAVIGAAVLLLISSFLAFYSMPDSKYCATVGCSPSVWTQGLLPTLATVHLLGLITAGLVVAARMLPEGRKLIGVGFGQWAIVLSVVVAWSAIWSLLPSLGGTGAELGAGAWLTLLFALALTAAAVLNSTLPALKAPLVPESRPKPQAAPFGAQGGYGYPGQAQPGQPGQPMPGQQAPYGAQQGGYGYPGQAQPQPQPAQAGQPQAGAPAPGPAEPAFQPFWFAVPVARPLFGEDGSPQPVAELAPGTWYLAVEARGQALVAQTQDGRRGVLQDASGIQRG